MGRPKPLLPLEGATYLERVLWRLDAGGMARSVVVLGHSAETVLERVPLDPETTLVHRGWAAGMLSSLQAGLRHAEGLWPDADGALVLPVDVPRFAPETVRALLSARARRRAPLVLPEYEGSHGHPALFGRELWPELLRPHPGRGAQAVVDAHRDDLVVVPVPDPWIVRDADTPREHERMIAGTHEPGAGRR